MGIYLILVFLAIVGFALNLEMFRVLRMNGFKINYYDGGITNLSNFYSVIKNEENRRVKLNYSILFVVSIVTIILFILAAIVSIMNDG